MEESLNWGPCHEPTESTGLGKHVSCSCGARMKCIGVSQGKMSVLSYYAAILPL